MKQSFVISDSDNEKLKEIQERYKIGKSDQVRRAISMLHDYLIKDVEHPTTDLTLITENNEEHDEVPEDATSKAV